MRRPAYLISFLLVAALFGALLFSLRLGMTSPSLSTEWKVGLLLGAAGLCLLLAITGLGVWLRWRNQTTRSLPLAAVLGLAYLAPMLVLVAPAWVELFLRLPTERLPSALLGAEGLSAGQPLCYLWSVALLLGYELLVETPRWGVSTIMRREGWRLLLGLLAGMGLWLASTFTFSLQAGSLIVEPPPLAPFLRTANAVVAVLVAPLVVESFFRGRLLSSWQGRLGGWGASLASAALFATLQFRLLLWIPAFVLGLGLAELTRRSSSRTAGIDIPHPDGILHDSSRILSERRIYPAVLAHSVYNVLSLFLAWYMVM